MYQYRIFQFHFRSFELIIIIKNQQIFSIDLDSELASVLTAIGKNPSIKSLNMTRSFTGMKLKHIATVMDALVGLIQKDDFPLTELILAENKLKNDIHDFINALGSNQSLQKLGEYIQCFYPSIHPHTSRRIRTFLPVI